MKCLILVIFGLTTSLAGPVSFEDLFSISSQKFATAIYKETARQNEENFLVSPLSAQLVLALSQSGARGETAEELQNALKLPIHRQLIECMVVKLLRDLGDEHDYVLQTINKIYLKNDYSIKEEFANIAREVYRAPIENIDFGKKNEAAGIINRWVEQVTNNKIHNLIDPELLGNKTKAILLNALRLKGNWSVPFQFFATSKQDFHTPSGTIKVDTMQISEEYLQFYEKPSLKATFLELPVVGGNMSMTIVLPNEKGGLINLEENLDEVLQPPSEKYEEMFNVALPKFKMESRINFKKILQNLGVKKAFEDGQADFSAIAGEKGDLFIDDVVQKTFIDVNEDGMEAAAATFVVKIVNRNGDMPREFTANHPFMFFIKVNNLVIFVGRVIVPYY